MKPVTQGELLDALEPCACSPVEIRRLLPAQSGVEM